jgi:hypothetical protein
MDRRAKARRSPPPARPKLKLAVCAGTTGPGSTHPVAGLYEASRDHAPVLALSGDMPRKLHGTDYIQTTEPDLLFRDVSLYTETISSSAQALLPLRPDVQCGYGVAPHRYVSQQRLETAMVLLAAGKRSLSYIALSCQFSSQASFNRAFRRATCVTPGEYRRARR